MVTNVDLAVVPSWFVVLPDCDSAANAAKLFRASGTREIAHASGRSWLLGRWEEGVLIAARAGDTTIAVTGQHAMTEAQVRDAAAQTRIVADLDRLARSMVGSVHLLASVAGRVRAQGTVTGVRRVFHASVAGALVAADRADVLAGVLGSEVNEQRLALHLLEPPTLYPLAGQPVWRGVELVPTDHYLVLDRDDRGRVVRWWTPPEPVLPMSEGAPALRDALSAAVDARACGREFITSDLGGLDSTAICSLAARSSTPVVAYTAEVSDPHADDARWAEVTVTALGNVEHHVIPGDEMPLAYHRVADMEERLDEPFALAVDRNRLLSTARRAASRGSTMHLTGFGGDELLYGSVAHMHSLLRTNPRIAMRHLRGFAVKYRWTYKAMMRQLLDRSPYDAWLHRMAGRLTAPAPPFEDPLLDWGFEPRLPPWATAATTDALQGLIRAQARTAEPLSRHRGQHRELETMRFLSRVARQLDDMSSHLGTAFAAPYYDDRVIEAGLAVRAEDRISPWRYKPLIMEAMRGVVPQETLRRQTKANATYEELAGVREHRGDLLALCEDSRLARLGLIDANGLREMICRPQPSYLETADLHPTMACEVWLRTLEASPGQLRRRDHARAA
jgi:asparagine synthase (glutamine-hydrolysing)